MPRKAVSKARMTIFVNPRTAQILEALAEKTGRTSSSYASRCLDAGLIQLAEAFRAEVAEASETAPPDPGSFGLDDIDETAASA